MNIPPVQSLAMARVREYASVMQEAHIFTGHILCELIEEEVFGDK